MVTIFQPRLCSSPTHGEPQILRLGRDAETSDFGRLFLHNPDVYSDPEEFKPERYRKTETHEPEQDPRVAAFGFGRRCV